MAMSTLMDRFRDPEYVNWVKLSQALLCVRDGLAPFCEGVIREIHDSLKLKIDPELQDKTCTVGSHKVVKRLKTPNKKQQWFSGCSNNICNAWLDVIVESFPTEWYTWNNCDVSKLPTESWQLAKLCMKKGQVPSNAAETEPLGLLQLVINCKEFHSCLDKHLAEKVRLMRNKLLLSKHFTVKDDAMKDHIADMVKLLQSGELARDNSAKEAVERLLEIKDTELDITDADVLRKEKDLWKDCICKGNDNREAIEEFIKSNEDLLEGLRSQLDQLTTDVDQLKNRADKTDERVGKNKELCAQMERRLREVEWTKSKDANIVQQQPEVNVQATLQGNSGGRNKRSSQQHNARVRKDTAHQRNTTTPTTSGVKYPHKEDAEREEEDNQLFKMYDVVAIEKDKNMVKTLHEDRGTWEPRMASVLGLNGIVDEVSEDGNVSVKCSDDRKYLFNPKLLKVVATSNTAIEIGDFVMVVDSYEKVKTLQDDYHGGWVDKMRKNLGSTGFVLSILPSGCAKVFIRGRRWTYNLEALRHIARSGSPTSNSISSDDVSSGDSKTFCIGEQVRVDSDESIAIRRQNEHGGWTNEMKQYLGKTGVIKGTFENLVEVQFSKGETWHFNKALLHPAEDTKQQEGMNNPFKRYDIVSIEEGEKRAKMLQTCHGGWAPGMDSVLGLRGYVEKVDNDGDIVVKCINQSMWCFNPELLKLIDTSEMAIKIGDFVLVINSYKKVKALQDRGHGGWVEEMQQTLGSVGTVVDVLSNGCARVVVSEGSWTYNVDALKVIARCDMTPFLNTKSWGSHSKCGGFETLLHSLAESSDGWMGGMMKDMSSDTTDEHDVETLLHSFAESSDGWMGGMMQMKDMSSDTTDE
ncbi:hypothetical protein LSAT2_004145, partial [Lamellibrachia satsuma]